MIRDATLSESTACRLSEDGLIFEAFEELYPGCDLILIKKPSDFVYYESMLVVFI